MRAPLPSFQFAPGFDPALPWYCDVCKDFFEAAHWLDGACRTPAAWFERFVLGPYGLGDARHMASGVTTTAFAATCPRRSRLKQLNAAPQIPDRKVTASVGTALHELLAQADVVGLSTEGRTDTIVRGVIDGVPVSGKIDALFSREGACIEIIDYKLHAPNAEAWAADKTDDMIQAGINMELARQDGYENIVGTWVLHCYYYHWGAPLWVPGTLTIEEVLEIRPQAGGPNVREALHMAATAQECTTVDEVLVRVPAVGERMYEDTNRLTKQRVPGTGKMCRRYCQFDVVCHPERYRGI